GPAVRKRVAHPLDPGGIDRLGRAAMEDARDPAHWRWTLGKRQRMVHPHSGRGQRKDGEQRRSAVDFVLRKRAYRWRGFDRVKVDQRVIGRAVEEPPRETEKR